VSHHRNGPKGYIHPGRKAVARKNNNRAAFDPSNVVTMAGDLVLLTGPNVPVNVPVSAGQNVPLSIRQLNVRFYRREAEGGQ
jgi:hypothetical protein